MIDGFDAGAGRRFLAGSADDARTRSRPSAPPWPDRRWPRRSPRPSPRSARIHRTRKARRAGSRSRRPAGRGARRVILPSGSTGRSAANGRRTPRPRHGGHPAAVIAGCRSWSQELAINGWRGVDHDLASASDRTIEALWAAPDLRRLAVLLDGLAAELRAASPIATMDRLPARRWADLWSPRAAAVAAGRAGRRRRAGVGPAAAARRRRARARHRRAGPGARGARGRDRAHPPGARQRLGGEGRHDRRSGGLAAAAASTALLPALAERRHGRAHRHAATAERRPDLARRRRPGPASRPTRSPPPGSLLVERRRAARRAAGPPSGRASPSPCWWRATPRRRTTHGDQLHRRAAGRRRLDRLPALPGPLTADLVARVDGVHRPVRWDAGRWSVQPLAVRGDRRSARRSPRTTATGRWVRRTTKGSRPRPRPATPSAVLRERAGTVAAQMTRSHPRTPTPTAGRCSTGGCSPGCSTARSRPRWSRRASPIVDDIGLPRRAARPVGLVDNVVQRFPELAAEFDGLLARSRPGSPEDDPRCPAQTEVRRAALVSKLLLNVFATGSGTVSAGQLAPLAGRRRLARAGARLRPRHLRPVPGTRGARPALGDRSRATWSTGCTCARCWPTRARGHS